MNDNKEDEKRRRNYIKNFFLYLIIINAVFYLCFKFIIKNEKNNNFSPIKEDIEKIKIGDGKSAKIGIISDIQLGGKYTPDSSKLFQNNLLKALIYLKKNNIDILIIAGDITNDGKAVNYLLFNTIFYSVYNYNQTTPIVISLMGNHDYMDMKSDIIQNQQKFFKYMKSYPYSHYIINNYNFIFWSNDNYNYNDNGIQDFSWIKMSLEKAKNNIIKEGDPIFVITHIPPMKTVYGSEGMWGSYGIFEAIKNYPEVICISGHSHYSLRNIKSIWQGNFTVINTQSLSYTDLDDFYKNARYVREDSMKNDSMGLIAYLNDKNIIFERVEFSTGEIEKEKWKIDFPINISNFVYTFDKRNKKVKPIFSDKNEIQIEKIKINNAFKNYIVFNAAYHEDYVYTYKIVLKNKDISREYFYYSDYYKNKRLRKERLKFELSDNISRGKYDVIIYAIDSFDNISEPKIGVIQIE